jgi:hypothetical protein
VSSSKLSSGEVADILTAAMASGTTDTFFEALDAADKAASDANFNALLAATAKAPSSFGKCVCGSEYSVAESRITLTDGERNAAAEELAWHERPAAVAGPYTREVDIVIAAINAAREQADRDFVADWNTAHLDCGIDL